MPAKFPTLLGTFSLNFHDIKPNDHLKHKPELASCASPLSLDRGRTIHRLAMALRFSSKESKRPTPLTMQQQNKQVAAEIRRKPQPPQVADLTDFMNDMFFGTVSAETKSYNLTGDLEDYIEDSPNSSTASTPTSTTTTPTTTSSNSKMTQEWLEEARRIVASSPSRSSSPARLATGSPRFAAPPGQAARLSFSSALDRRDPLSRSARRYVINICTSH